LPIWLSHRVGDRLYPPRCAAGETGRITARSSLGDVTYSFANSDWPATFVAIQGFLEWRNVVVANAVCRPGDTVLDVGAHMGTETLLFARRVGAGGAVHAFEPSPQVFPILTEMQRSNGLSQIRLYQAAVSNTPGQLRFVACGKAGELAEGRLAEANSENEGTICVESVVLDDLYRAGRFGRPALLTIDVEGAELFVLQGARHLIEESHPCILIEIHPFLLEKHQLTQEDVYSTLRQHGYGIFRVTAKGLKSIENWSARTIHCVCVPGGATPAGQRLARRIHRRLLCAALLPPIRQLNPAVVCGPSR
jgi:FkbM family methyltransferase